MIKVLVTGAAGQLGSSIRFVSNEFEDFIFDYTDVKELDINDPTSVNQYMKTTYPDYIINCAAYTNVEKAESDAESCFQLNAEAVANLKYGANLIKARIIHISTDYIFNGSQNEPYSETDIPDPKSVYGKSKLKGELYLKNEANALILRTSWLYSQYGNNFVKTIMQKGLEKKNLKVVSDQTGTPTYAPDLARAILHIIDYYESDQSFYPAIYNFSNQGITSWYEFAKEIVRLANLDCEIIPITTEEFPMVAPRPLYSVLSKEKIMTTFGLEIPHWKESLKNCITQLN